MLNILAVFTGGGIGAVTRYILGVLFANHIKTNLPIATFFVNIIGCLILGFLYIFFTEKLQVSPNIKLLLTAGFCGGLTTFSTFSAESWHMIQNAQYINALIYIILSIFVGLAAVFFGGFLCKHFII